MSTVVSEEVVQPTPDKKKRIWELDFIRGFLILLMVVDHLMITVAFFFGPEWFSLSDGAQNGFTKFFDNALFYYYHDARKVYIQPIVVVIFITLCGLSTGFSRNNLKRGCVLGLVSLAVTAVTYAVPDSSLLILFGILHMLTFCILTWSIISAVTKNNKKANLIIGLLFSIIVFALYFAAKSKPDFADKLANGAFFLFQTDESFGMSPGDFYPLIPWAGIFYMAAALSPFLYPDKTTHLKRLDGKWNKPLCFIGRHTLIVYATHILIIIAVLELVSFFAFDSWLFVDML